MERRSDSLSLSFPAGVCILSAAATAQQGAPASAANRAVSFVVRSSRRLTDLNGKARSNVRMAALLILELRSRPSQTFSSRERLV